MRRGAGIRLAAILLSLLVATTAVADARTDFLVRMLSTSTQFRVRVQAALALGAQSPDAKIVGALARALGDGHPSVRAASATALERLNDGSALPALRNAQRDRDSDVRRAVDKAIASISGSSGGQRPDTGGGEVGPAPTPSGPATYYVGVGIPGDRVGLPATEISRLHDYVVRTVQAIEGVVIAPERESESAARSVISQRRLAGFYVDGSVTKVEVRPDGAVRAEVSVVVGMYPGRSIKAMLSGAATVPGGGSSPVARQRAIEGAFTGALRRLPQAMRAGAVAQGM